MIFGFANFDIVNPHIDCAVQAIDLVFVDQL